MLAPAFRTPELSPDLPSGPCPRAVGQHACQMCLGHLAQAFPLQTSHCLCETNDCPLLFPSLLVCVLCSVGNMALSHLVGARWPMDMTHNASNVSPFEDPRNPQFGLGSHRGPGGDTPLLKGSAAELRQRNERRRFHLRGSFSRAESAPPAPALEPSAPPPEPGQLPSPMPNAAPSEEED